VGREYNEDIRIELRTGREVVIPEPQLPAAVALVHQAKVAASKVRIQRLLDAKRLTEQIVTVDLAKEKDNLLKSELAVKLAEIQNELDVLQDQFDNPPGPQLVGDDKAKMDGAWRGYNTRVSKLEEYRGRTCSLILGQCTTVLKDKLKHDADYKAVIDSGKPLQYKSLIEKTIMAQAEDQYNCAAVHDQMCHLLGFSQGALSNDQYYERFNTRVDVSKSVGVSWVQDGITKPLSKVLYKKELHLLTTDELKETRDQAAERFLTYVFTKNSSSAHAKLKEDLKNDFAKGHDNYPTNRQEGLRLLDMFTQQDTRKPTIVSEGSSFGTVSEKRSYTDYDVEYWANKTCRCCGKKGHPGWSHTPEEQAESRKAQQEKKRKLIKQEPKESDNESVGSTKSKSSKSTATKSTATKNANLKKAAKAFATVMVENMGPLREDDSDSDREWRL
jgi:hypothetical protein